MKLSTLADLANLGEKLDKLCECIQNYAQQPGVQPCETFPFNISGSIVQTAVCHILTFVMQVPKGVTGVITRISLQERYPGTLYGANFMLGAADKLCLMLQINKATQGRISQASGRSSRLRRSLVT
jgi:hypothetical protein